MNREEIDKYLREGEGTKVEFKRDFSDQGHSFAKVMCAFANTEGGILFLGVGDTGNVLGVDKPDEAIRRLTGFARSCSPSLSPTFGRVEYENGRVVVYAIIERKPPCQYQHIFWKRVGSSCERADLDEVKYLYEKSRPIDEITSTGKPDLDQALLSQPYTETFKPPRVFISYSWESEDHKVWVRYLGERLYQAGIEARLDQWFVKPGESFTVFMEQEVEQGDFVIVVCTPAYAQKSNNRRGGVGYEQQIVSAHLMAGTARSKFIPILRSGDYKPGPDCAIPTHFLGIAWIDFRDDAAFDKSLEDLIRVIFSKPRFAPPPLGSPPLLQTSSKLDFVHF